MDPEPAADLMALYEREGASLYRLALRITASREDARDAVQDAFTRLIERRPDLDGIVNPGAWLRTVLARAAIDLRRKRYRDLEMRREQAVESFAEAQSGEDAGGDFLETAEAVQIVRAALDELSALDRAIVLMKASQDAPLEEIGRAVGLTEKAVRNRLSRARAFLKRQMRKAEGAR